METVGRQYNADVPTFLKDRPSTFIRNCMDKMNLASVVDATDVEKLSSTSFKVITLASIPVLDALYTIMFLWIQLVK